MPISRKLASLILGVSVALVAAAPASAATFTNPNAITISAAGSTNANPYPSSVVVSGMTGPVSDVNVTLNNVSHTFPDDVGIVLVGPAGQALLIQDGAGDDPDLVGITYTLDDQAGAQLPNNTAWAAGSYRPTAYFSGDSFPAPGPGLVYSHPGPAAGGGTATLNGTFSNTNPNGTWRLFVRDFVDGDGGSIAGGWALTVTSTPDTTAPDTSIAAGPSGTTASRDATFAFAATEASTFECSLDGEAFAGCPSPRAYGGLADGSHTFSVRARDVYGNVDPSPATRTFTVDATRPTTAIDSGPAGTVNSSSVTFAFSADEPVSFACKLDDAAFVDCASPQDYTGLADGLHVFQLRATDAAGNVDRTGAGRAFTVQTAIANPVDSTNPTAQVTKPKPKRGAKKATVEFTGSDDHTPASALKFSCSLDGAAAKPCTSPTTLKHLKAGTHGFFVVAEDAAGNLSAPASASFKIRAKKKRR